MAWGLLLPSWAKQGMVWVQQVRPCRSGSGASRERVEGFFHQVNTADGTDLHAL